MTYPRKVNLPKEVTPELAYFIGAILGDGSIKTPIRRNKGGYYWEVSIACNQDYSRIARKIIWDLFALEPVVWKDKRKRDCYQVNIYSKELHNYLTDYLNLHPGKKAGKMPWPEKCISSQDLFKNFLAGLMDTDGYVGKKYLGLVQKDKAFLEKIKKTASDIMGIEFNGPNVNRKIDGKIVGWIISLSKKEAMTTFLNEVPLKYKKLP